MPVSTESLISGPFYPNGATTDFAFDFKAVSASEVVAVDADGVIISTALYSVTIDSDEGGTLSFATAPVLADYSQIYVVGRPALTQTSDFGNTGPSFNPAALTRALDRAAIRDLRQQGEIDRAIKAPFGEAGPTLPSVDDRAGLHWKWNADGSIGTADPSDFSQPASDQADRSEAGANISQTWATGTLPGGPGTKSSREWSDVSQSFSVDAEDAADIAAGQRNYFTTIAAGIAATTAPNTFSSDEIGELTWYDAAGNAIGIPALRSRLFGIRLSREGKSSFTPAQMEALVAEASAAKVPLLLDVDHTISGDVAITSPVHIIQAPGVTTTLASTKTLDNGISTAASAFYAYGIFAFHAGSEGSVFEAYGTFTGAIGGTGDGKSAQGSAVLVYATDHVTLKGTPTIENSFDGVIVVDSDFFKMTEPWHGVSLSNAVLDIEGSDDFFAMVRGTDCEEVVDCQYSNNRGELHVWGDKISQGTLEFNNSHNVRAHVYAHNCRALEYNEYLSGADRWSGRGRAYPENRNCNVEALCILDADYDDSIPTGGSLFNCRRGEGLTLNGEVRISGAIGALLPVLAATSTDFTDSHISIKVRSDTRIGTLLCNCTGYRTYYEFDIEAPMNSGDQAIYVKDSADSTINIKRLDGRGSGTAVKVDTRATRTRIIGTHLAVNVEKKVDLSNTASGSMRFEPYFEGATSDRPASSDYLQIGQRFKNTETGRWSAAYLLAGTTMGWDYTEQSVAASAGGASSFLVPGYATVTGADGTNGVKLDTASTYGDKPTTIYNAGSSALKVYANTGVTIDGTAQGSFTVAAGKTATLRAAGTNFVLL